MAACFRPVLALRCLDIWVGLLCSVNCNCNFFILAGKRPQLTADFQGGPCLTSTGTGKIQCKHRRKEQNISKKQNIYKKQHVYKKIMKN